MNDSHRNSLVLVILLLAAIGAVAGWKYYRFMNNDPAFCAVCHMTKEGHDSWEKSPHYRFICQECHVMSVIEGNKLLMGQFVKGDKSVKQTHGRITPWTRCIGCHTPEAEQGSVTLRSSYGHAKHVFMNNISCSNCHTGKLHDMKVRSESCQKCHSDKLVHGMGTAGLSCLNCHKFSDSGGHKMTSSARCFECHKTIERTGKMKKIECHECHHPHQKLKITSDDCLGTCHSSETRVGQHKLHAERTGLECLNCHKPHSWEINKSNARGLCDRCHKMKDPASFIF